MNIDAVITWVNGDDPKHRAKRMKYGNQSIHESEDVAGSTRFNSLGEIFYCIASLNRFAPWLHKIYIVTDEQNPCVESFLRTHFPEGYIPIEIVDHTTIFRGYEQYLPTFNSISIETMTWRIPGLSEHYIELNDDFILSSPATPEDFFLSDGRVVCYASPYNMPWTKLTRMLKPSKNGRQRVTFKGNMYNAAFMMGRRMNFLKFDHTPRALRKSYYERFFSEFPETLTHNITFRFRHADQYSPQEVMFLLLLKEGKLYLQSAKGRLFFLQPKSDTGYVKKKMQSLTKMRDCKFCCFNSLDKATPEEREEIIDWIETKLSIHKTKCRM